MTPQPSANPLAAIRARHARHYDAWEDNHNMQVSADIDALLALVDQHAAQVRQLREALTGLRDYFAYGQREHQGMAAVATPRCSPSVWKEIKSRVDAALVSAQE